MSGGRRTKYALMTGALLACITGVGGLAITLADMYSLRLDATATRAHSLDERTLRLLDELENEHELVISADLARLAPASTAALADMLDAFEREENMRVTVIDSRDALADLITRLASRDRDDIVRHAEAIASVRTRLTEAQGDAGALTRLLAEREGTDSAIATITSATAALAPLDRALEALVESPFPGVRLPEADRASDAIDEPGARLVTALNALERELNGARSEAASAGDASTAAWARSASAMLERVRGAMQRANDTLRSLEPLEPLRLARALEQREIILVIGPERTTALDVRSLVPDPDASGADAVRAVREGERSIATALAAAGVDHPPILVLVHGATQRLLGRDGRFVPQLREQFGALGDRLMRRRIGLAEWPVAMGEAMPDRDALDPTGRRPIVWMTTGIPSPGTPDRYARLLAMSGALTRLVQNGESLLLTLPPSDASSLGETDAIATVTRAFGLNVRTDAPLITAIEEGVFIGRDVRETAPGGPLSPSLQGLPTFLNLPSPIETLDPMPAGATVFPLLIVPDEGETWGESSWFNIVYARAGVPAAPTADPASDLLDGPYVVAASATRARTDSEPSPTIEGAQRLVVVTGSDAWFTTDVLAGERVVDGARTLNFPGNAALFDASISYLAGLDELLAREARAPDVARIGPLSDAQLLALRFALIAGLPLGILALGGVWRLVRR